MLGFGVLTVMFSSLVPLTPWGWVGLLFPTNQFATASVFALLGLFVLGVGVTIMVPWMLERLQLSDLLGQSVRWDAAVMHASGMDLALAATAYEPRRIHGRRLRAVRVNRRLATVFFFRDAIASARTPGRLILGSALLAVAALPLVSSLRTGANPLLGAIAGLVLFLGLGSFTDGVRYAANLAGDLTLFGISDRKLLSIHLLFPVSVALFVLTMVTVAYAMSAQMNLLEPLVAAVILGLLALLCRVNGAVKGPMPIALLNPITTPMGDLAALVRAVWALDGLLLAGASGAAVVLMSSAPTLLVLVLTLALGTVWRRWRHRR